MTGKDVATDDEEVRTKATREIKGLKDTAALLGLTPMRVRQLVKEGIFQTDGRAKYDIYKVVPAYVEFLRRQRGNLTAPAGSIEDSRTRKARAEADMAERASAKQAGLLIEAAVAEERWGAVLTRIRARLLALKVKMAPLVAVEVEIAACEKVIEDQIYDVLQEMSDGSGNGDEPAPWTIGEDEATAAEAGGDPVLVDAPAAPEAEASAEADDFGVG